MEGAASGVKSELSNNHKELEEEINKLNLNSSEPESSTFETNSNNTNNVVDGKSIGAVPGLDILPPGFLYTKSKPNDDVYNMNHEKRGHCLIFNHRVFDDHLKLGERGGTDNDRDNIGRLFSALGFDVAIKNNLSMKGIQNTLREYAYEVDHSDSDCFVVVFMSHGEEGQVFARDGIIKSESLYNSFTAEECKSLAGKPKLFFMQACRGDQLDHGTMMVKVRDETDSGETDMYRIPNHADFLMCWSTVPGHFSWRNTTNGSWFIQSLYHVFRDHALTHDVLSMMTMVNRYLILNFESNCPSSPDMHGRKQTSSVVTTLMRRVFLKPKK